MRARPMRDGMYVSRQYEQYERRLSEGSYAQGSTDEGCMCQGCLSVAAVRARDSYTRVRGGERGRESQPHAQP